jgi:hypothetical protein
VLWHGLGVGTPEVIIMRAKLLNIAAALALGLAVVQAMTGMIMRMGPEQTTAECRWVRGHGLFCEPADYT